MPSKPEVHTRSMWLRTLFLTSSLRVPFVKGSCHLAFFTSQAQVTRVHSRIWDRDPNFTCSEWMRENCQLCSELTLHLSVADTRGGLCCANVKGEKKSVPQLTFYRRNPHKAGEGLVHSKSPELIHLPQAHLNLQTSSYRTGIALFIWIETGWWNIREMNFYNWFK